MNKGTQMKTLRAAVIAIGTLTVALVSGSALAEDIDKITITHDAVVAQLVDVTPTHVLTVHAVEVEDFTLIATTPLPERQRNLLAESTVTSNVITPVYNSFEVGWQSYNF